MTTNAVSLHRVLRCPPDRVCRAYTTPAAMELRAVFCGTELHIKQEGISDVIPAEACYLTRDSLTLLAQLAEPEINP